MLMMPQPPSAQGGMDDRLGDVRSLDAGLLDHGLHRDLVDEQVMLTREEQEQVMDMVRRIIRNDRVRRIRIQQMAQSEKSAKQAFERDLENLADLLKEVG